MSNYNISTYKFKPFQFQVLKKNVILREQPLAIGGHPVVSNNANLYSYGGYNPERSNANSHRRSSVTRGIWKYCFHLGEWRIIACKNVPQELTTSTVSLSGNIFLIYGGIGFPMEEFCINHMYLGNLANEFTEDGMKIEKLQVTGDVPMPIFAQGVAMYGKYVYLLSGTSDHDYEMDVHQLDLCTKTWELLYKSRGEYLEPEHRYPQDVVYYKSKIYLFGGGRAVPSNIYYGFQNIHIFDVITKKWQSEPAKPDVRVPKPGYPSSRDCFSCCHCPESPNLVYLSGGFDGIQRFSDVWRFDIDHLQWENLTMCVMPWPIYFHSTTVTPSGRMCTFGGLVSTDGIAGNLRRSNDIISAWITIPKLEVIAWEAMIYYFKDQMFASTDDDLKKSGIPKEYYDRIIEERRIHKICPLKNN